MPWVATVRGRRVDGDATVVAEALEVAAFPFLLSELAIRPNAWVGATGRGCIGRCGWVAARFYWCRGRGCLPVPARGCGLLALVFPVTSVALQGGDLELLEHLGPVQRQELILDALSKSPIEITIESHTIPSCMGCMFGKLDHVLVDMLVILHFECVKGTFRGLGQIGLPKVSVQLVDKLTPIIANGRFQECNQDRLPPKHGDVGEVQSCVRHSLAVSHKLARSAIKGHDTANNEGAQL